MLEENNMSQKIMSDIISHLRAELSVCERLCRGNYHLTLPIQLENLPKTHLAQQETYPMQQSWRDDA